MKEFDLEKGIRSQIEEFGKIHMIRSLVWDMMIGMNYIGRLMCRNDKYYIAQFNRNNQS